MISPNGFLGRLFKQFLFAATITISILILPSGVKAATIVVGAGGDFQAAIGAANCGDDIVLQAGATFSGNFTLRYKGGCSGTEYITIRTSNLSGIPPVGTRINPAYAAQMAKLVSPNGTATLQAEDGANHYKLIGIEISNIGGSVVTAELVLIGGATHHITF